MAAEPTDDDLFEFAETLLFEVAAHIRSDRAFIRHAVLEQRDLWVLLWEAHWPDGDDA